MSQFRRQPADIRIVTAGFIFQVAFGEMKSLWLALLVLFTPISGVIGIRLKSNEYIIIMKKVTIVIFAIVFYFMRQLYQKYMKKLKLGVKEKMFYNTPKICWKTERIQHGNSNYTGRGIERGSRFVALCI